MTTLVLVDGNSVGWKHHAGGAKLRSGELETQAIFGFIRSLRNMRIAYSGANIITLWDGRAQWRFDMHPDYKSNRDNDAKKAKLKEGYVAQRPYISRACELLGVTQITSFGHEADDLAGFLVEKKAPTVDQVILQTGDHDWMQLVRSNVAWVDVLDPTNIVTLQNIMDKTGYSTPLEFLQGKALVGDTSDVIPGLPGVGDKTAAEFIARWGSVANYLRAVDSGQHTPAVRKSKVSKTLHPEQLIASSEGRRIFLRNMKLMQLMKVTPPAPSQTTMSQSPLNEDGFMEFCEELSFASIKGSFDQFIAPFRN